MLDPLSDWVNALSTNLKPTLLPSVAAANLSREVGKLMNKVQPDVAGPQLYNGQIFTFNEPVFMGLLLLLTPTQGNEWATKISDAWFAACSASVITPSTVTDATTWTSSSTDVATLPSAISTITTLSTCKEALKASLLQCTMSSSTSEESREKFAKAFREATLKFSFTLIGLKLVGTVPTPYPQTFSAK